MAGTRRTARYAAQAPRSTSIHGLGKDGKKEVAHVLRDATSSDESDSDEDEMNHNATNDDNDDDEEEEEDDDDDSDDSDENLDEANVEALSRTYPFDFDNDGSKSGSDDEMDLEDSHNLADNNEFVKSMELADYHAIAASDGDDYTAVDEVSDDDDGDLQDGDIEDDVLREAEKDLIAEFEDSEHQRAMYSIDSHVPSNRTRKVSFDDSEDDTANLPSGVNMNADPFGGASFMDDQWAPLWETAELGIWRKPLQDSHANDQARNPRQKRVRFQESSTALARVSSNDSSSSSEDDDAEQFPDIFVEQSDPKIRHLLDRDSEDQEWHGLTGNGSDVESVYDFEDDADRFAFDIDEESASSEADASSESEDDGDETEDETVEEQQVKMQQFRKAMKQAAGATTPSTPVAEMPESSHDGFKTPSSKRTISPRSAKGPRQGTFICDPTKAILTTDKSTRKTILYPPARPTPQHKAFWDRARSAVQSSAGSPRGPIAIPAMSRDISPERPFTAKATLGSMFDGRIDIFDEAAPLPATQVTQPFPVFSPSVMSSFNAGDDGSDMDAEYPAAFNTMLNMDKFDDDSSDTDMNTPGPHTGEPAFLAHGVVGSFRLNQHRARLESSLPSNPAKRASAAEQNALQNGRRAAGNAPITPARKRRSNSQDMFRTGSGVKKNTALALSSPLVARRRHSRGQSLSGRLDQTLTPEMWKRM